jgi:RNase P protein component
VVPLATRRNRIKRLIREAVRGSAFFEAEKVYTFKVRKFPEDLNLALVRKEIDELKNK